MASFIESLLASVLPVVLVVEVALAAPLAKSFQTMATLSQKSVRIIASSHISDHWKEKVLPAYAGRIFLSSLLLLFWLALLAAVFALGLYAGAWVVADNFEGFRVLQRADYLLSSFVIAAVYLFARRRLRRT